MKNYQIESGVEVGLYNDKETLEQELLNKKGELVIFSGKKKSNAFSEAETMAIINDQNVLEFIPTPKSAFKTQAKYRAIMLIFQCFMAVGRYYAYDNPQALEIPLKNILGINNFFYNLLYSVYSLPNIIVPFIGGFIVDYYGVRTGIFIFTFIVTLGQGILWLGGYMENYWVILIGRVVFGLTGECVEVAHQNIAVDWFRNSLGLVISFGVALSRIGSACNSFFTPKFYEFSSDLSFPLMVGFFVCFFSFISGLIVIWMDRKSDEQEGILTKKIMQKSTDMLFESNRIKSFDKLFWVLVLSCSLTYSTTMGFLNISNDYIVNRFNYTPDSAGNIIAIYYLISMIFTPLAGKFTDIYGKRIYFMIASNIILLGSMLAWFILPNCDHCLTPDIIFFFMGLNISVYAAAFWPSIALLVDSKLIGIAYGCVYSALNICLIIIPLIIGKIQDNWGFFAVNIYLIGQSVVALLLVFFLKWIDHHKGNRLDRKPNNSSELLMKEI